MSNLVDSRLAQNGIRRRRYQCGGCGERFSTYEVKADALDRLEELCRNISSLAAGISHA